MKVSDILKEGWSSAFGDRSQKIQEVKRQIERRMGGDTKFQFMVSLIDDRIFHRHAY